MTNYLNNFSTKNFSNIIVSLFNVKNFRCLLNIYSGLILNSDYLDLERFSSINVLESVEYIKMQELGFLPEYYFITILFCITLFSLFSLKVIDKDQNFSIKFQYNNQLIFLLVFGLTCYLILILQQINISILSLISFNDTIHNDQLSLIAKLVIGLSSILYLIFITQYLKNQKLSNFEYYIILFTSIFGFFLLCGANDLITAYLAIELQGLSFYVLASFKKSSNFSIESGVKYFVLGSLSTAIFLLGTTFIYGFSGSVVLTDFKDFFIWVFSANSFFLSSDSIFKALEAFQERISLSDNFSTIKLQIILDKLDLFKKKFYMLPSDVLFFQPNDIWGEINSKESELCNRISNKMINLSKNIDDFSYFYYEDHNYCYLYSEEFCDHATKILATKNFLMENLFQNIFIWLLSILAEDYDKSEYGYYIYYDLKDQLIKSNFYESNNSDSFFDFLITNLQSNIQMNKTFVVNFKDFNLNPLLDIFSNSDVSKYSYKGYSIVNNNLNKDVLFLTVFKDVLDDIKLFNSTSSYLLTKEFVENNFLTFNKCTEDLLNDQIEALKQINPELLSQIKNEWYLDNDSIISKNSNISNYIFSIINILSFSNFFLELSDINSLDYYFMFEFSFVIFGFLIIIFAIFFKLALAPFHLWAPDVYEGSPSSSTFFFMIVSKFSLFIFLLRLCYLSFYSLIAHWQFYSLIVATISIFIGAVAGLKQRRLKSLLTYSSINNMGFVLLALSTGSFEGIQSKFYYLVIYIISGLCIWAIILNLKLKKKTYINKQNRDLGDLVLLQESNNIVAQNLAITLFTLAGLPPTAGFLAKMGVFKALSGVSIYFFSLINILFSVIATFYYIRIIKIIFFENLLVGKLYNTISTKKTFIINILIFLLLFLFISPMLLYFYSYKVTLFLNKAFY